MSDNSITRTQLEAIAERALTFQRYVFRRAWGIYYAVWAAAITVFSFIGYLPLSQSDVWLVFPLFYGGVGLLAGLASTWIFSNALRTLRLRRVLAKDEGRGHRKYYGILLGWWVTFYALIGASFAFFATHAMSILFASLFSVEIFIYYQLKLSFSNKMPFEGKLALISYGFSTTFSFVVSIFSNNTTLFSVAWGTTIIAWLFCALYALRRAPEELAALVY